MTQQNGIDEWIEVTEYFRYIEDMIERNFKTELWHKFKRILCAL